MNPDKQDKNAYTGKASGRQCWESPSNIALVKYWGKYPGQIPMNPSLSFVLKESVIRICIDYDIKPEYSFKLTGFKLNGQQNEGFARRIESFLTGIQTHFLFLKHARLKITSESTFPHSAGIASSAAAFSALALCLCSIEAKQLGTNTKNREFLQKASFVSRLGSGSACRSLYDGMVLWGESEFIHESSDEYAVRLDNERVHSDFYTLRDAILIIDDGTKPVSSSEGHALMHQHPFREVRKQQAHGNLKKLLLALSGGNKKLFCEIVENEALSLHSLMMSSNPGYLLMKPNTIHAIDVIRRFRVSTNIPLCFTLDAGPNIHLIHFEEDRQAVRELVQNELKDFCKEGKWIDDSMGNGPKQF